MMKLMYVDCEGNRTEHYFNYYGKRSICGRAERDECGPGKGRKMCVHCERKVAKARKESFDAII
jgi:hypothetical protein